MTGPAVFPLSPRRAGQPLASGHSAFAYAQTRLQARHGARPQAIHWQQLAATRDLGHFLQLARNTPLRPWVLHIEPHQDVHTMERSLRQLLHTHILDVARWLPAPWRPALHWTRWLAELPALQHLLRGDTAPSWLLDDPLLRPYASEDRHLRLAALRESVLGGLLTDWQAGETLPRAWLRAWRKRWPADASPRQRAGLETLTTLLLRHLDAFPLLEPAQTRAASQQLEQRLERLFRREAGQPAAGFVHLALFALDIERLRGALVRRALFPGREAALP